MKSLFGVYRAVCLGVDTESDSVSCQVPQIFADETVTCLDITGGLPSAGDVGWVAFESGFPDRPVWLSAGGATTEIPPGGAAGQVLGKLSGADYDIDWINQTGTGGTATVSFVYHQASAAASWVITHNLGWYPNFTVIDSTGTRQEGDVVYNTANQLTLTFSGAFAGTAYLS